jgi:hypothetical protein
MSVLVELDAFRWALIDAGPAFDALFGMDRIGFLHLHLIDLTRADFCAVTAAATFFLVNKRIHRNFKFQISNCKYQINSKLKYPMTKADLNAMRSALCSVPLVSRPVLFHRLIPGWVYSRFDRS